MKAEVAILVYTAQQRDKLWPWAAELSQVETVAAFGPAIAPLLLELLSANPDYDTDADWQVEQQVALALCKIYGVNPEPGRVYMNRATAETNAQIKPYWTHAVEAE